ncbi:tumor necrosis factor receptor superfamily member 18 [Pagrus major]|uniref:tumor necrosis factor receptor superfamily member 18 n=1 Tax=Pagrus major TaxID=143350 RepID=UPI003CC89C56
MIASSFSLAVIWVLNIGTIQHVAGCDEQQMEVEGRCCNMCPPGEFLKELCTEQHQTVCSPCEMGSYSSEYNMFGKCEECSSCQQEYAEKCTPTANVRCRCSSGFLCSNNVCSSCEENKCVTGERRNRTVIDKSASEGLEEYSYHCEPICSDNAYYEVKDNVCKPRTQCAIIGLAELFPGNKTHNSVCDGGASDNHPINVVAVSANTSEYHLSKEESGCQLIIQDESKHSDSLGHLHLENVSAL